MTRRIGPLAVIVGVLCVSCGWAQTNPSTPDTTGPKPAYTYDDQTPATQPGPQPAFTYPDTTPSLDFLNGTIENSSITLGIGAGFAFDSNGYPTTVGNATQSRWLFNLTPSIRIQQFLPRLAWHASYAGGYQYFDQVSGPGNQNNNQLAQIARGGFLWQMARRWQLSGDDSYHYSANPFDSYVTIPGTPSINNPNPISYYPLSNFTQNNAFLTLSYLLSKRDSLAFTGTANYRDTSTYNVLTSVPFYNLISYGGRVAYSHEISPRLSLGAGYDFNSLDFGHGQQRSGIQTITFTADYLINPNMTISGWVGPEYTSTKDVIYVPILGQLVPVTSRSSIWSPALGLNFGWRNSRNSIRAAYTQQVTDGGGIIATSKSYLVNAFYRRQITYKWSGLLGGRYSHNVSIQQTARNFDNASLDAAVTYQISKSFQATAAYVYVHQTQSNAFLIGGNTYNDNRVGVNISYSWTHPLGR